MHVDEWDLIWRLGLALVLSASIGLDRELRQQSAGLRTHTLVGIGSALFMPSWASTASPMSCAPATASSSIPRPGVLSLSFHQPGAAAASIADSQAPAAVRVAYEDGRGILRKILATATRRDFKVADVDVRHHDEGADVPPGAVTVSLEVQGKGSVPELAGALDEIDGVLSVKAGDVSEIFD